VPQYIGIPGHFRRRFVLFRTVPTGADNKAYIPYARSNYLDVVASILAHACTVYHYIYESMLAARSIYLRDPKAIKLLLPLRRIRSDETGQRLMKRLPSMGDCAVQTAVFSTSSEIGIFPTSLIYFASHSKKYSNTLKCNYRFEQMPRKKNTLAYLVPQQECYPSF
jgi:hypothetical protein